jgi:hypothetical protein
MAMITNIPNNVEWQYISVGQPNCTYQCRHPLFTLNWTSMFGWNGHWGGGGNLMTIQ